MDRRICKGGYIFQIGRKPNDEWSPDVSVGLRYNTDRAGEQGRTKGYVNLGKFRTRTLAEQAAMQELIKLGLFDTQKQSELIGPATTLRERSRLWLLDMENGRVLTKKKQTRYTLTTVRGYESALAYLNAKLGDMPLAEIEANDVYELLIEMRNAFEPDGNRKFSDKTIREYYLVLKLAIESAVHPKTRRPMYRKDWTAQQIALPSVNKRLQKRPKFSTNHVEDIIGKAAGQYAVLYSLLTGSGLRIREALALEVKHIGPKGRTVNVCQQQCKVTGEVKPHGKTDAAIRRVDLHSDLGLLLTDYIGNRKEGFLFRTPSDRMLNPSNISRDSLAGILEEIGYTDGTSPFHAFRRFRESRLIRAGAHPILINYWMGHEGKDMAALYGEQLTGVDLEDVKWRQEWAEKASLGFTLPELVGQTGQMPLERVAA